SSLLSLLLLFVCSFLVAARDQTVGARGQLMCGDYPLNNTEVKLWELDTWPDPDDLLMTVTTDMNGRFQIWGTENEVTTISPVVKIYHRCNNKGLFSIPNFCKRKTTYAIPSSYISNGKTVQRWYDMGTMNMEAKQKNEDTECI
ncbi:hypothetical protein PFISCL1PPCAC_26665, partial [Pristionchus fissidentatus]